jgi:Cu/Ag efflux pump CusA
VKEYQVDLDPNKLAAYDIPLSDVVAKIRRSNSDVGGKTFEVSSTEYFVRGRGYVMMFNATFDVTENHWKALSNYEMLQVRKFAENVYYHEFARDLRQLGYEIENKPRVDF